MQLEDHCKIDKLVFKEEYPKVHEWIDSSFEGLQAFPHFHWIINHHKAAIDARFEKGTMEHRSAYLHVVCDWLSHFEVMYMPDNGYDVLKCLGKVSEYYRISKKKT